MVAEFGLECLDFDIFNYVDPALDAALDAGAAEILNTVDRDINFNSLATDFVRESCVRTGPNRYQLGLGIQENLAGVDGELQSLKGQVHQQQELILELQQKLNNLMAIHQTKLPEEPEQQKQMQVSSGDN